MNQLCWYLIHTHPKQEDRVEGNLRAWQLETFAPKFKDRRYNEFTGRPTFTIKPLFPRYVFARLNLDKLYHKVRFTRGIRALVSFGEGPVRVADEVIRLIKSRVSEDGLIMPHEELRPGQEVVVTQGPLRELTGILDCELSASERVRILLTAVRFQVHIVLDRELIERKKEP